MGIFFHALPASVAWITSAIAAILMIACWIRAPWQRIAANHVLFVWLASTTVLAITWRFNVKVQPDFMLYLLGTPLVALMFGPALAILSVGIALAFYTYVIDGQWANLGLNLLINGALPAFVSHGVLRISQQVLPKNIFVFLFVSSFFGGVVSISSVMIASVMVHAIAGYYDTVYLFEQVLPSALLLAWGEAITLGMIASTLTIYAPSVMLSFDDRTYLARRPPPPGDGPGDGHDFGDPGKL